MSSEPTIWGGNSLPQLEGQSIPEYGTFDELSLAVASISQLDDLLVLLLEHSLAVTGGQQGCVLSGEPSDLACVASRDSSGRDLGRT
ncbi:MAG: hypothetical protein KGR26_10720, partial [Cyanobacteria bacterium REEB65]|nr:hypothetical protein [Cyanobacteria bacterium REEB65]